MAQSDKKVKVMTVMKNVTLESTDAGTQAAASRTVVDTYRSDKLNLAVSYTTGSGETSNTAHVKVWGYIGTKNNNSDFPYTTTNIQSDSDNWVQIGTTGNSSGTVTYTASVFDVIGASAATTYTQHFDIDITFPHIMVTASEAGVATNKGTITVVTLTQ